MSTWRNTAVGAWAVAMSLTAGHSLAKSDQTSSFTLGNGLEVVVIEDHRAPVVGKPKTTGDLLPLEVIPRFGSATSIALPTLISGIRSWQRKRTIMRKKKSPVRC